jgi:hypothetical protein
MLSERKQLLQAAEAIAIGGTLAALWLADEAYQTPVPEFPVYWVLLAGMAALLLTFLPAWLLIGEYVRTVRKHASWRERTVGLSSSEIEAVFRWSPKPYVYAACAGVAIAVTTAIKFGSITFSSSQSVISEDVTVLGLYFSVCFLLSLPVLGSAARMPGNYASSDA